MDNVIHVNSIAFNVKKIIVNNVIPNITFLNLIVSLANLIVKIVINQPVKHVPMDTTLKVKNVINVKRIVFLVHQTLVLLAKKDTIKLVGYAINVNSLV